MRYAVKPFDPHSETLTEEGCYIVELSNSVDDSGCSVARARVPPQVTTCWHRLDGIAERYVILEGQGSVEVGDEPPRPVSMGDVVLIPPNRRQRITSTGMGDLIFLAICTPRFEWSAYEWLSAIV